MKVTKYLNLIFILGLIFSISFSGCDKILDDDDPIIEDQVGDTLWVHDMTGDEYIINGPSLAYDHKNSTAYYSKSGGQINWTPSSIVAVDVTDGSQKWISLAIDHIGLSSSLVIGDDGTIYVIGYHTLYAINPVNGQFKWTWEVPKELTNSDGNLVYTYEQIGKVSLLSSGDLILGSVGSGVYHRGMYSISSSGIMNWYNLEANGVGVHSNNIAIDANDNAYYYTRIANQTKLVSINGATGVIRWTKDFYSEGSADNNILIAPNGSLICSMKLVPEELFHMYQLNSQNGDIQWKSNVEAESSMKLMDKDGKIYQQNWGGVFTFAAADGQKSSYGSLNKSIVGAVINSDNQMAIIHEVDWVANVNMYDPNGTVNWRVGYEGLKPEYMVITDDKKIIVFKQKGMVAFQGKASEATSGWPTKNHDYRNTNNVLK